MDGNFIKIVTLGWYTMSATFSTIFLLYPLQMKYRFNMLKQEQ